LNNTEEKLLINDRSVAYTCPLTVLDCDICKNDISTEKTLSIVSFSPLLAINVSLKCTKKNDRMSSATKLTSAVKLASANTRNVRLSSPELSGKTKYEYIQ